MTAGPAAAVTFLAAIDDMPLMDGLSETDGQTVFETPFGRIIETEAVGAGEREAVSQFYAETLPSLGWLPANSGDATLNAFERGDETLQILVTEAGDTVSAKFRLIARPASSRMAP